MNNGLDRMVWVCKFAPALSFEQTAMMCNNTIRFLMANVFILIIFWPSEILIYAFYAC
jgi:hypothetical protein